MQTRAMKRKALAEGAPATNPTVTDTSPNTTSAIESEPGSFHLPSWNSVCIDSECPIKHPHNFGLRPQTLSAPERVPLRHGAHAAISSDHGYPDTQPPPLIKAIIDALRMNRDITIIYDSFPAVLRDFYRAHGGRSDKYHGSAGMFGFGVFVTPSVHGDGVCVLHKHPECDYTVDWLEFDSPGFGIRPIYGHPEGEGNGEPAHGYPIRSSCFESSVSTELAKRLTGQSLPLIIIISI